MNLRRLLTIAILVGAVGAIGFQLRGLLADPTVWPPDDYVEYYAAGKLNAEGQNPYDPRLLLPLERAAGRDTDVAVMMWNPPWTLPFVEPFGLMPPRFGQLLFLVVSLAMVLVSADGIWRLAGGSIDRRWMAWLVALTSMPTLFALQSGQIGPFLLFGLYLHLAFTHANRPMLAGAATVLLAIKPHLFAAVWLGILFSWNWRVWIGGVGGGVVCSLIAMATNTDVFAQFRHAMATHPPEDFASPTIGAYLRSIFGVQYFRLQFLPVLFGVLWFVWHHRTTARHWARELPMLVMASMLFAPYGAWPFDLVVLVYPAVVLAVVAPRGFLVAHVLINGGQLVMNLLRIEAFYFIWVTPAWMLAFALLTTPPKDES